MGQCMYPFSVENTKRMLPSDPYRIPVPCGRCPECLKRRTSMWSFRLRMEERVCKSSHFVTLTYDTEHVPISKNKFMTLDKSDLQKFFKRLRKSTPGIRYYACGEYGGKFRRPHYHIILFNSNEKSIKNAWMLSGVPLGHVHIGYVSGASIGYTLKYVCKGRFTPMHRNDDRNPEFALMSKGIGLNWLTPSVIRSYKSNLEKAYITIEDGKRIAIPRYFKDKIYTDEEKRIQKQFVQQYKEDEKPSTMSERDLVEANKAKIAKYRKKHLKRADL